MGICKQPNAYGIYNIFVLEIVLEIYITTPSKVYLKTWPVC